MSLLELRSFEIETKMTLQLATQSCWQNVLVTLGLGFKKKRNLDYLVDLKISKHGAFDICEFLDKNKAESLFISSSKI